MPKHTDKNIETLVNTIVDGLDIDCLVELAKESLTESYKNNKKFFNKVWKQTFNSEDE